MHSAICCTLSTLWSCFICPGGNTQPASLLSHPNLLSVKLSPWPVWTRGIWGRGQWVGIIPAAPLYMDLLWALGKLQSWLILLFSSLSSLLPGDSGSHSLPLLSTQDFCAHREASVTQLISKKYILRFPALETLMLDDNKLSNPNCFASLAGLRRYCQGLPLRHPQPRVLHSGCTAWNEVPAPCLCCFGQVSSLSELSLAEKHKVTRVILVLCGMPRIIKP